MNKILITTLFCSCLASSLKGCNGNDKLDITIDYPSAEKYEQALNDGEDTIGKIVKFVPIEIRPEGTFGYTIWAGEHLNFISDFDPKAKVGKPLVVKVITVNSFLSSWLISYSLDVK